MNECVFSSVTLFLGLIFHQWGWRLFVCSRRKRDVVENERWNWVILSLGTRSWAYLIPSSVCLTRVEVDPVVRQQRTVDWNGENPLVPLSLLVTFDYVDWATSRHSLPLWSKICWQKLLKLGVISHGWSMFEYISNYHISKRLLFDGREMKRDESKVLHTKTELVHLVFESC